VGGPRGRFGLAVLGLALLCALAAPVVSAGDPAAQRGAVATRFLPPPSSDLHCVVHPLGTDRFGRDVWTRLVYGARISLGVGTLAVLLSVAIGLVVGAVAGFSSGPVPVVLLALTDFALALPRVALLPLLPALRRPPAALALARLGLTAA